MTKGADPLMALCARRLTRIATGDKAQASLKEARNSSTGRAADLTTHRGSLASPTTRSHHSDEVASVIPSPRCRSRASVVAAALG